MIIQFLAFSGCPLAASARENLEKALAEYGKHDYEEIDILDADVPDDLRAWGSPTILINGRDVTGLPKSNSVCCRVYPGPEGVPEVRTIIDCLRAG